METPINDREILNTEIAKLRQANLDFGELSPCIGIAPYFPPSPEEYKVNIGETTNNDVNAPDLALLSPCKLDPSTTRENEVAAVDSLALLLALNKKINAAVASCLKNIRIALDQNRDQQEYLKGTVSDFDLGAVIVKKRNLTLFGKPYFRDIEGSYPEPNTDTINKYRNQEVDAFTRPSKPWTVETKDDLMRAVRADFLQRRLRPLMNREQIELEKLKNAIDDSEEKRKIEETLRNIQLAKNEISNSGDLLYGTLGEVNAIDWMKIATSDMKEQRTLENCKSFWKNAVHPLINKTKWTKAEDERLVELAKEFNGRRWETIAELLGTRRSAFMCLRRYQTKFNPLLRGKWTLREDKLLEKSVSHASKQIGPISWPKIAKSVGTKSMLECEYRWGKIKNRVLNKSAWNPDLDKKLCEATKVFGSNWMKVAKYVPGKNSGQCSDRYKNKLKDSLKSGPWSQEEDEILWKACKQHGLDGKWSKISAEFLPNRTDNQILLRYRRLLFYKEYEKEMRAKKNAENNENGLNSENNENGQNTESFSDDPMITPKVPRTIKYSERKSKARPKQESDDDSPFFGRGATPDIPDKDYAFRKRDHKNSENSFAEFESGLGKYEDDDDEEEEEEVEVEVEDEELSAKRPRLEELDSNFNNAGGAGHAGAKVSPEARITKKCVLNEEIVNLLAYNIKKKQAMDDYKANQRSQPTFKEETESKVINLIGNALKLPISNDDMSNPTKLRLLPPVRSTIVAFAKLMNDRQNLVYSAGLFQFPKSIKFPEPWERSQIEKFVETSRTFGNLLPMERTFNSSHKPMLLFNPEKATANDKEVIASLKELLNGGHNRYEVISKHNQASRICRQIRSSEDYLKLQLKFTSLFFWPLLLNYSSSED